MQSSAIAAVLGCGIASILILCIRLVVRLVYVKRLDLGNYLAILAIVTVSGFIAFTYVTLTWGTVTTPVLGLTPENIRHRTVGSKCLLAARVMQVTTYVCVLTFQLSLLVAN
jgi:hypothetical protein